MVLRSIRVIATLALLLQFSSCFEITEDITWNADGSGFIVLMLNLSESKPRMDDYMRQKEVQGYKVPKKQEVEQKLELARKTLASTPGFTQVSTQLDWKNYIFSLRGRFSTLASLNNGVNKVMSELDNGSKVYTGDHYTFSKSQFQRKNPYDWKPERYAELPMTLRYMLEKARLTTVYRFPVEVQKSSNPKARVSPNKTALKLTEPISALAKGSVSLENRVTLQIK